MAVRKDVYDALRREKRPGESFTQLFLRLLNQRGPLEELRGRWPSAKPSTDAHAWRRLRFGPTARGGNG